MAQHRDEGDVIDRATAVGAANGDTPRPPADRPAQTGKLRNHPLRHVLANELHARPFAALNPPERVSFLALHTGEDGAAADHDSLVRLCERYGITPPQAGINHFAQDFGRFRLKWERHTEFVTYSFFRRGAFAQPFREPVIDEVAGDWLDQLHGEVLVAVHVAILPREAPAGSAAAWSPTVPPPPSPTTASMPMASRACSSTIAASANAGPAGWCSGCWRSRPTG
jgi:hypothetical protein